MNLVRWGLLILAMALVLIYYRPYAGFWAAMAFIISVFLVTCLFGLFYARLARQAASAPEETLKVLSRVFLAQNLLDLAAIALGIHLGGGLRSPAPILFVLHLGMIAVLLPGRVLYILAALEAVLYAGQMEAYLAGWLQPYPLPAEFDFILPDDYLRTVIFLYVVFIVLNGLLVGAHAGHLHLARAQAEDRSNFLLRLNELTRQSLTHVTPHHLFQYLADNLGMVLGADGAYLTRWDEEQQLTIPLAAYGPMRADYPKTAIEPGERTLTESLRRVGGPLIVADVLHTEYLSPRIAAQFPTRSLLALPLYSHPEGTYWGAAIVSYHQMHKFTPEEVERARQVVDLVSVLISRSNLFHETIEQAELLRELSLYMAQIASDLQPANLLPAIVESARALLKSQGAALFLYDRETDTLSCAHAVGLSRDFVAELNARFREDASARAVMDGKSLLLVPDIWEDERIAPFRELIHKENYHACAIFVLQMPEEAMGVLGVFWDQARAITSAEVAIAQLFAEQAGAALHSADLYARATQRSLTDAVTGLPNRRALDQRLHEEIARFLRHAGAFTLVMLDLDGFKGINDRYGHPMGDSVLQQAAITMRRALRATDFISRYGGDEFVLILPETRLQDALTVVKKLHLSLASCDLHLPQATQHVITACMGLAAFPTDARTAEELIGVADARLYIAKGRGPDEVEPGNGGKG